MNVVKIFTDGLRGFAVIFSIILTVKMFLFLIGVTESLNIEVMDIYNSSVGFILIVITTYTRSLK